MSPLGGPGSAENRHRSCDRAPSSYEIAADGTFGVKYDALGRITDLPSQFSGGGKLETDYYVNDLTRSQTQDGITNTYKLDSAGRQRERTRTKGEEESTEIYHYANGSDSPAWVDEGEGQWSRFIGGIGASAIEKSATEDIVFQLADMHGDIVATADDSIEATELLSTQQFDEYGNPKGGEATAKLGWLGSKLRRTELPSGVIQMGVRSYVPAMGRFLSPDPVLGGSANAYEYADGDPVNEFDLEGTCSTKRACAAARRRARARVRRATRRIRARMRKARMRRARTRGTQRSRPRRGSARTSTVVAPPRLPWEKDVNRALNKVGDFVKGIFSQSCGDAAERLAYAGGTAGGAGVLLAKGGPASAAVGGILIGLGARLGIAAGILYGGSKLGIC